MLISYRHDRFWLALIGLGWDWSALTGFGFGIGWLWLALVRFAVLLMFWCVLACFGRFCCFWPRPWAGGVFGTRVMLVVQWSPGRSSGARARH